MRVRVCLFVCARVAFCLVTSGTLRQTGHELDCAKQRLTRLRRGPLCDVDAQLTRLESNKTPNLEAQILNTKH
jgi:hypothetical protein